MISGSACQKTVWPGGDHALVAANIRQKFHVSYK